MNDIAVSPEVPVVRAKEVDEVKILMEGSGGREKEHNYLEPVHVSDYLLLW